MRGKGFFQSLICCSTQTDSYRFLFSLLLILFSHMKRIAEKKYFFPYDRNFILLYNSRPVHANHMTFNYAILFYAFFIYQY